VLGLVALIGPRLSVEDVPPSGLKPEHMFVTWR
jgi:hypothetical protein